MDHSEELTALVDAWCNRQADEAEVQRLEAILLEEPQARRYYRRVMNLHAGLHARCEGDEGVVVPLPAGGHRAAVTWGGWAVAAVLAVLFVAWTLVSRAWETESEAPAVVQGVTDTTIGLMVSEAGAQFSGMREDLPIQFVQGDYVLEKGIVHLRLTNGVDVVMRGPARFGIRDETHVTLESGVLRAIVPNSGYGFVIESPEMLFEDLGTEFGVSVEEGKSEMHVFTGQVNARKPGEEGVVSSVYGGESLRQVGADVTVDRSGPGVQFPSPQDVGYAGWLKHRPAATVPEGLIAHFPFKHDPQRPEVLENVVTIGNGQKLVGDGMVQGARWVSGRWSEKDALLFDREGDWVELDIPGEFNEISMAAWVHIDHLDHAVNAVFTSDGWRPGSLHWQVLRTQDPILAVHEIHESGSLLKRPIRLGRWIHLVAVLSKEAGRTRFYVDGQLAQENQLPADALIKPGKARLGDWLQEDPDPFPGRSLKGKVDEFAVWNRALSAEEVVAMTRAGAPSMLSLAERLEPVKRPSAGAMFHTSRRKAGE